MSLSLPMHLFKNHIKYPKKVQAVIAVICFYTVGTVVFNKHNTYFEALSAMSFCIEFAFTV